MSDLIDRQRALDAFDYWVKSPMVGYSNGLLRLHEMLEEIPPVTPEPCDDCISRQAAIDAFNAFADEVNQDTDIHEAIEIVLNLPPVTPAPKNGEWIIYDVHGHKACKCSKCNNDVGYPCTDKYCKHCGAKMEDVEE